LCDDHTIGILSAGIEHAGNVFWPILAIGVHDQVVIVFVGRRRVRKADRYGALVSNIAGKRPDADAANVPQRSDAGKLRPRYCRPIVDDENVDRHLPVTGIRVEGDKQPFQG
jgi:hypothetical protein